MTRIIILHGAIGVGKSTFIDRVRRLNDPGYNVIRRKSGGDTGILSGDTISFDDDTVLFDPSLVDICNSEGFTAALIPEPVERWVDGADLDPKGDHSANVLSIQERILETYVDIIDHVKLLKDYVDLFIIERSAWDSANVFTPLNSPKTSHDGSLCERIENELVSIPGTTVERIMISASPRDMIERVASRGVSTVNLSDNGKSGAEKITAEYSGKLSLERLHIALENEVCQSSEALVKWHSDGKLIRKPYTEDPSINHTETGIVGDILREKQSEIAKILSEAPKQTVSSDCRDQREIVKALRSVQEYNMDAIKRIGALRAEAERVKEIGDYVDYIVSVDEMYKTVSGSLDFSHTLVNPPCIKEFYKSVDRVISDLRTQHCT